MSLVCRGILFEDRVWKSNISKHVKAFQLNLQQWHWAKCFNFFVFYVCLSVCRVVKGNVCRKVAHCFCLVYTIKKWKRTNKTYSPMDDDEQKDKTQSTVTTIKCLRQGNENKLTQKTDREGRRRKQWRRGQKTSFLDRGVLDTNHCWSSKQCRTALAPKV